MLDTNIERAKQPLKKLPNVITSFSEEGYEKYGKRFVESWLEHWPKSIRLTVYYEGENFDFVDGVSWVPIEMVEFLPDYLNALKPFPVLNGIIGDRYDINFDARMGRKTFMQVHTCRKYGGKVFWIDADVETYKHVPETFLDQCLPDEKFSCFLGRDGWYYTESGFIGFNSDHPIAVRFFKDYLHTFIVGSIFTQGPQYHKGVLVAGGWHDCVAFDCIRHLTYRDGYEGEFVNLASDVPKGTMHPFENCAPGTVMHHYKGDRKETRTLKKGDLVAV